MRRTLTPEQAEAVWVALNEECAFEADPDAWQAACRHGFSEHDFLALHSEAPGGIVLHLKALGLWLYTNDPLPLPTGLQIRVGRIRARLAELSEEFGPCEVEEWQLPAPGALSRPSGLAERVEHLFV